MNNKLEAPAIKKVAEIGETSFQYIGEKEKILQGWDKELKKMLYLFKTDTGNWGYWDKETSQLIKVTQWKEKAALINSRWVKMALYHRIYVIFDQPITFSEWDSSQKKRVQKTTQDAIITITDSAFKQLEEQMNGRAQESWYKFEFMKRNKGSYVNKVKWVK